MGGSGPQNLPQIPDRRIELLPPRRKYSDVGLNQLDQQLKVVAWNLPGFVAEVIPCLFPLGNSFGQKHTCLRAVMRTSLPA
jgi:hypothetical protein